MIRRIVAHVVALVVLTVLLNLGAWQLRREAFKADLDRDATARRALPVVALDSLRTAPAEHLWRRVTLDPAKINPSVFWLLDNRTLDGKPGYEVFARYEGGTEPLLVSLGWLGPFVNRAAVPEVALQLQPPITAQVNPMPSAGVEGLVQTPEPEVLASGLFRVPTLETVLVTQPELATDAALTTLAPQIENGAVRLPEPRFTAERHHAYAVQWFVMALVFSVLYVKAMFFRRRRP